MNKREALGPAERTIDLLLRFTDHLVHNRPGMVTGEPAQAIGVRWQPVTRRDEQGASVVYRLDGKGRKQKESRVGVLRGGEIFDGARRVGRYQPAGLFPEAAAWMYGRIAEIYQLDQALVARFASWSFAREHRDLKVALAAFMLCQTRRGDPVREGGEVLFFDEDLRDVGEAMCLLRRDDGKDLNPKLLLRVGDLLRLAPIAELNRSLGFGRSARAPFLGRWPKAVTKWLRHREENPRLLEGLVRAGFRTTVMELARRVGYKPATPRFFEVLRWKQKQAKDGRRDLALGQAVRAAESWAGLDEAAICAEIVGKRPSWKRIVALVPTALGVTRAIVAAAMEAGVLSDKDLVIITPTLEALGLLEVAAVKARWSAAVRRAEDQRALNIAKNVRTAEVKEALEEAADRAVQAAVAEVVKDLRVYFFVDVSGSMEGAIEAAKRHLARFLQAFPMERLHVAVFNTMGRELPIPHPSGAGVERAFHGVTAGGGTDYGAGVLALKKHRPADDEDVLFIFVGDEQASPFPREVEKSKLRPMAFGLVKMQSALWAGCVRGRDDVAVTETATALGIPCFRIEEATFADPYAIPRTVRALVAATPVGAGSQRRNLIEEILETPLLAKPSWAA